MQKEFESSYEPKINLKLKCSILNDSSFASLVLLNDTRIAGASSDNIKIYNPKNNFHCDFIILNTTEITSLSLLSTGNVASVSIDNAIKIWEISTTNYRCVFTINKAHQEKINKVISISSERLASCSDDATIKLWYNNPSKKFKMINSLHGHINHVTSIIEVNEKLISSSLDYNIKLWNTETFQCERNISIGTQCCDSNVFSLVNENTLVVIADTQIGIINTKSFEMFKK